jgi:hypothetical protein
MRARFVERFSMGAPVMGGEVHGPAITGLLPVTCRPNRKSLFESFPHVWGCIAGLPDKISWVEKFAVVGRPASEAAKAEHER